MCEYKNAKVGQMTGRELLALKSPLGCLSRGLLYSEGREVCLPFLHPSDEKRVKL